MKSDRGLDTWIERRVSHDRFHELATLLGEVELLPYVQEYAVARDRHLAFNVNSIAMIPDA